jgi:hypothetical protein
MRRSPPRWRSERFAVEPERAQDGSVLIWLDPGIMAKLKALRGPGESYSDVILQVAKGEGA